MRSSLSAYILNLTDEKLQQRMRNQCREFLVEPISSHIKITNIVVKIADNPMDQHIIAFSRTIRTYLEHSLKYN